MEKQSKNNYERRNHWLWKEKAHHCRRWRCKNIKKVAQAAAEKIFEQFVHARREKKEKIDKLKEEAKATATPENPDPQPNINPNEIDCFLYMPDYPLTYEEASALNSFKYALNALVYIEERPVIIEK